MKYKGLLFLLMTIIHLNVFCQTSPNTYWVQFTDKLESPFSIDQPEEFLSARSIQRRQNQGIKISIQDIPVNQSYIDEVLALGEIELLLRSKWFNAITVRTENASLIDEIESLDFVSQVKSMRKKVKSKFKEKELDNDLVKDFDPSVYGSSFEQLREVNAQSLHEKGFFGNGKLIFVCDGGYTNYDVMDAFEHVISNGRLIGTRDFVDGDDNVFHGSTHGTSVSGVMAGLLPGELKGGATEASYFLARTENTSSEYLIEEDNWVSAAELADSIGADIINTSLGYTMFNDASQDHNYEDLDGQTTRIAIAAGIAAQKGMLVVQSAGNYHNQPWHFIGTPADAKNILAVGAMTKDSVRSSFSSVGPSADGRIKPEIVARGSQVVTARSNNDGTATVNGTSFSSPLIAGVSACLWEAYPSATSLQIRESIIHSAHQFMNPDNQMGYGIPDFSIAMSYLANELGIPAKGAENSSVFLSVHPIPANDIVTISMRSNQSKVLNGQLLLFSASGELLSEYTIELYTYSRLIDLPLLGFSHGVYILVFESEFGKEYIKIVKS